MQRISETDGDLAKDILARSMQFGVKPMLTVES